MPERIQRKRTKGWRKPEGAIYVGRGTKWGNPFVLGAAQVRMPARDGSDWEYEGRLHKTSGERHFYCTGTDAHGMPVGTWHQAEDATATQCVELFRDYVTGNPARLNYQHKPMVKEIRDQLAGKDLMCWCPLDQPCHADMLLEIANEASW